MKNLLIIEPDDELAETLKIYFSADYEVSVKKTAQEAVSSADAAMPDAVILELAMSEHNGVAFLQEFRSYNDWLNVPVVIYTHIPRDDIGLSDAEWNKLGVIKYLYKPTVSLDKLGKTLKDVVMLKR